MFSLNCDVWNTILNFMRNMNPVVKGIVVTCAILLTFFCFAKCINKGKNHAERPIKWSLLVLGIVFFAVAILFVVF